MHPNAGRYPFAVFLEHTRQWPQARSLAEVIPKPEQSDVLIHVGAFQPHEANILRASHMISATTPAAANRDFQVDRFVKILRYIGANMQTLTKEFVIINDGKIAPVEREILAAIHEAFLDEPIPNFLSVTVKNVAARAKEFQRLGIS